MINMWVGTFERIIYQPYLSILRVFGLNTMVKSFGNKIQLGCEGVLPKNVF